MSSATGSGLGTECLVITTDERAPVTVVGLSGFLQPSTAPVLRRSLDRAILSEATQVLVDLADLQHLDRACVDVFDRAAKEAGVVGVRLALRRPRAEIAATLTGVGVRRRRTLLSDDAEADRWLGGSHGTERRRLFGNGLVATPSGSTFARRLVREWCWQCGLAGMAPGVRLAASELVTSACLRGSDPVLVLEDVRFASGSRVLRVEVWEGDRNPRPVDDDQTRSLLLHRLCRGWGRERTLEGVLTWAEFVPPIQLAPTWPRSG